MILLALAALASAAEPWPDVPTERTVVPVGGSAGSDGLGPRGAWVVTRPVLDGIPVEISARTRLDAQGHVRREWVPELPPTDARGPVLDERAATDAALRQFPGATSRATLRWLPTSGALRRFWTIDLDPPFPMRGFVRPRVTLDAETGAVVGIEERSASAAPRAYAYRHNPVVDPAPEDVPLAGVTDTLSSDLMDVRQCSDVGQIDHVAALAGTWSVHVCTVGPPVEEVGGSWYADPVPWAPDPASDEDAFVASHVYWNVRRGLDWFADHGWAPQPGFDRFLSITVNQRYPDYWAADVMGDPQGALVPYNNAFYSPDSPELVFGQGEEADFGYDADVILHELGHFIVDTRGGPQSSGIEDYGYSIEGKALNEALADYFSSAIQGNPLVGEYIDDDAIRDLSGSATCADRYGEPHYDGEPFAQTLWTFRASLPDDAERDAFDEAVLDGLSGMGVDPTFAGAVGVIEGEVADALGPAAAATLTDVFEGRGLDDCPPIVDVEPGPYVFRGFTRAPGWYDAWTTPVPGYVQLRVEIPAGGATLVLRGTQSEYRGLDLWGDNVPQALGIVGRSGASLTWQWDAVGHADPVRYRWTSDGEPVATFARTGTAPKPSDPVHYLTHAYEARWTVTEPGPYVFQLTNAAAREVWVSDLRLSLEPLVPPEAEGCGCATSSDPTSPAVLAALLAVAARRPRCSNRGDAANRRGAR